MKRILLPLVVLVHLVLVRQQIFSPSYAMFEDSKIVPGSVIVSVVPANSAGSGHFIIDLSSELPNEDDYRYSTGSGISFATDLDIFSPRPGNRSTPFEIGTLTNKTNGNISLSYSVSAPLQSGHLNFSQHRQLPSFTPLTLSPGQSGVLVVTLHTHNNTPRGLYSGMVIVTCRLQNGSEYTFSFPLYAELTN